MIRRLTLAIGLPALLLNAPGAQAQMSLGVAGGPVFPLGDFGDALESGFHGGVVLGLGFPLLPVSLRGDLMFQRLPGTADGRDYRHLAGTVNARLDLLPLPLIATYLTAGAGMYVSDYEDPDTTVEQGWSSEPGLNGGVGVSVSLLFIRPFAELRYHRVLTDEGRSFVPFTVGVTLF